MADIPDRDLRGFLARAAAVVAVALLVLGLFGTWQAARENGKRLEQALGDLDEQKQVNGQLLVKVSRQGERIRLQTIELRALRDALRDAGIDPDRVLLPTTPAEGNPPPAGPGTDDAAAPPTTGGGSASPRPTHTPAGGEPDPRPDSDNPPPEGPPRDEPLARVCADPVPCIVVDPNPLLEGH